MKLLRYINFTINEKKEIITICFDIDGVICKIVANNNYKNAKPLKKNINIVNTLYEKGFNIILFTARYMGRSKENIDLAKKRGFKLTSDQLKTWNVKYNKLIFGKPSFDLVIDDKSIFFNKQWPSFLKKKLL